MIKMLIIENCAFTSATVSAYEVASIKNIKFLLSHSFLIGIPCDSSRCAYKCFLEMIA